MPYSTSRLFTPLLGLILLTLSSTVVAQTDRISLAIQELQSNDYDIRMSAVRELSNLADARAVEPLCRILQDEDHPMRFYAADLLTKIHDARAIRPLISVLGVRVNGIGQLAADGLVGIGVPAVDELIVSLSNADSIVRQLAIKALGRIKDERALIPLLDGLDDEILDVRRQALVAVMNFEGDLVTEAALTALQDPGLRVEASLLLGERKDLRALPSLIETLRVSDPVNAERAHRALILIGELGVTELIGIVRDRNPEYPMREERQRLELSKLQVQFRCGNEPPPPILDPRRLAAIALGRIGDRRAIAALTEALKDENPGLRADAAQALANLKATEVEP